MNHLQNSLKINAIFSSISGAIMILSHKSLAKLFGTDNNTVFWVTGVILIYFSLTIWYEIGKQRKLAVIWIIVQDYTWVLGSLVLILLNPFAITPIGNWIIGAIALIVLFMGVNQTIALKKTSTTNS
ncbi:hypothetical protein PXD56_09920 [Maribacter sp. SA7]|uniref:hypothetical protein n=1 Tax=Maribacter zhoushanensis TaxID=3030012 RepID=UPI0023EA87AD|nr:hypothetical protein [Maribacter zhoushanensis]MDF4203272.1 hypothetical protein [Maribacter zhoushanensis]